MYDNVNQEYLPDEFPEPIYPAPILDNVLNTKSFNIVKDTFERIEANAWLEETAIVNHDSGHEISYAELLAETNQLAAALLELGVESGDRVLWRFGEVPEAIVSQLAILKVGAVNVPSVPMERAKELEFYLNDTQSRYIIASDQDIQEVEKALAQNDSVEEVIIKGSHDEYHSYDSLLSDVDEYEGYSETSPSDVASIFYTGGTTGKPKGCVHSHAAELAGADLGGKIGRDLQEDDWMFCPAPVGHTHANQEKVFMPLRRGAKVILADRPSASEILEIIEEYEITRYTSLGAIAKMMVQKGNIDEYDLTSINQFILLDNDRELYSEIEDAVGVEPNNMFGMTPLGTNFITAHRGGDKVAPDTSLGKPYPGYEARIVDIDDPDPEEQLGRNEVGRIAIRGPTSITYWTNIHPDMPERMHKDTVGQWSILDDAFYRDEDGYLYYVSRLDDMIVSGGRQIAPPEVEEILESHDDVLKAGVIGIPDDVRGEKVKAFVSVRDSAEKTEHLITELQEYAKDQMAPYKYPREVEFIDEIPVDEVGKVQRMELEELEEPS